MSRAGTDGPGIRAGQAAARASTTELGELLSVLVHDARHRRAKRPGHADG